MDDDEKRRFLNEVKSAVRRTAEWVDEHEKSGEPLSPESVALVGQIRLQLKALREALDDLKSGNMDPPPAR
jgi:hypothetical protein